MDTGVQRSLTRGLSVPLGSLQLERENPHILSGEGWDQGENTHFTVSKVPPWP